MFKNASQLNKKVLNRGSFVAAPLVALVFARLDEVVVFVFLNYTIPK